MKALFAILTIFASPCLLAQDITFKGATWDSLAPVLDITPFYLTVDKPLKVKSVSVEIDLYVKGVFVKTFSPGGLSQADDAPLKLNWAVHFMPSKDGSIPATIAMEWGESQMRTSFSLKEGILKGIKFSNGGGSGAMSSEISVPGRWPVFKIIKGTNKIVNYDTPAGIIKANPDAIVMIGYVKAE